MSLLPSLIGTGLGLLNTGVLGGQQPQPQPPQPLPRPVSPEGPDDMQFLQYTAPDGTVQTSTLGPASMGPGIENEGRLVQRGGALFRIEGGQLTPVESSAGPLLVRDGQIIPSNLARQALPRPGTAEFAAAQELGLPGVGQTTGRRRTTTGRTTAGRGVTGTGTRAARGLSPELQGLILQQPEHRRDFLTGVFMAQPQLAARVRLANKQISSTKAAKFNREYQQVTAAMRGQPPEARTAMWEQLLTNWGKELVEPNPLESTLAQEEADSPARLIAKLREKRTNGERITLEDYTYTDPQTGEPKFMKEYYDAQPDSPANKAADARLIEAQNKLSQQFQERRQELDMDALRMAFPKLASNAKNPYDATLQPGLHAFWENDRTYQAIAFRQQALDLMDAQQPRAPAQRPGPPVPAAAQPPSAVAPPVRLKFEGLSDTQYLDLWRNGRIKVGEFVSTDDGRIVEVQAGGRPKEASF